MDIFSLTSTSHCSTTSFLAGKNLSTTSTTIPVTLHHPLIVSNTNTTTASSSSSPTPDHFRRPKPLPPPKIPTPPKVKFASNPLKNILNPQTTPPPKNTLTNKLWLTSKLSPPPPPPPPPLPTLTAARTLPEESTRIESRQEGKIFVGNLPLWIKKRELSEFFRQFGPIDNAIVIKGYNETERNMGFGFVIYGGPTADKSAMKAVEFDGVEFHGRVLTVKLDDGRRLKGKAEERARWVAGDDSVEHRSKWHEEREGSRREFHKALETPQDWQAVVGAFEKIKKVWPFYDFRPL